MKSKLLYLLILSLLLAACAGGTRGTGALIDRRLMDTHDDKPVKKENKEPPLLNKWFGWECGDLDEDGVDDCKY